MEAGDKWQINAASFSYFLIYSDTSMEARLRRASLLPRAVDGVVGKALCVKRSLGKSRNWKGDMTVGREGKTGIVMISPRQH